MRRLSTLLPVLVLIVPPQLAAQAADTLTIERARSLYFQQDFDGGSMIAEALVQQQPDDAEAHAWLAINMSRNSDAEDAKRTAASMLERWPELHWSQIAQAFVYNYAERDTSISLAAAERAVELAPDDPWAAWARGLMLLSAGRRADAVAFLDGYVDRATELPELLSVRANAIMLQGTGTDADTTLLQQGFDAFAEVRERDPTNVSAWFFPASTLLNLRRVDEALPLLVRALELAPHSLNIHQRYWSALTMRRDLDADERKAIILAGADRLVAERGHRPAMLSALARTYREHGALETQQALEERVLHEHPHSAAADWVLVGRYRAISNALSRGEAEDTTAARAEYRRLVWEYINRPSHAVEPLLGDAYLSMLSIVEDDTEFRVDDLLRLARGAAQYNRGNPHATHTTAPILLADRDVHLEEAEEIVRAGFEQVDRFMELNRGMFDTVGEYADYEAWLMALHHDALGWVLYRRGDLDGARTELERALELRKELPIAHYHLGRMAEEAGDLDEAETHYGRGRGFEIYGRKYNGPALQALFERRHGSLDGYDEYVAVLDEKDRARRREKIAASRLEEPRPVPEFELAFLDGGSFAFERMRGRIGVINFWGVWCGPCIQEAPQIQQFHEKYRDDPDVVFITIDNDPDPETVRQFMARRQFDFPVLLDDGYVTRAKVQAFPTTWFIDRDGRVAFEHVGASDVVFEEFVWRVELLRSPATDD
jgi:tetratricopeptide (TPR) repeat protein/peroxiredoxin